MNQVASNQRQIVADKVLLLASFFGPLAGGLVVAAFLLLNVLWGNSEGVTKSEGAPDFIQLLSEMGFVFLTGYLVGLMPAVLAGYLMRNYIRRSGTRPWLAGVMIGALTPPVCLLPFQILAVKQNGLLAWLPGPLTLSAVAAALGLGAALITELFGWWLLGKQFLAKGVIADHEAAVVN